MKKMTYVEALNNALNGNFSDETVERLTALRDSYAQRAEKHSNTPTKKQTETAAIAEKLFAAMEQGITYSGTELSALVPELDHATPQKIWAVTKALGERVTSTKVKGKVAYSLT